jgi:hypothetical protein
MLIRTESYSEPVKRKVLYPIIASIIHEKFKQTGTWVGRDEIAYELTQREDSSSIVKSEWERNFARIKKEDKRHQKWETTVEGYAGNWVDWFSARFEPEGYDKEFCRAAACDDKWAYKPIGEGENI